MRDYTILRVIAKLLLPFVLLYGLYVQFHGDFGPGGGFQAGVIVAAGFILYALIFGLDALRRTLPPELVRVGIALGLLIFAGTGVAGMLLGANYLDYAVLAAEPARGEHYGILIVELSVGITVAAVLIAAFEAFAGRRG